MTDLNTKSVSHADGFFTLLQKELRLAFRKPGELINPLLFFVLVVTLFPLGVGPAPQLLTTLGPGVIWVAALLATLLALDRLFYSDFEDGALEQLLLQPHPLSLLALAKIISHWLVTGLPLVVLSPLLAVLLNLPPSAIPVLLLSLLLGTPTLSIVGAIGAALTVGLKRGGLLLTLLVLPLYIPVLIFGSGAVQAASVDLNTTGQLYILVAMLILALTLAPFAIAAALRVSVD